MRKYGFNFQWIMMWEAGKLPSLPDERALDFIVEFGFNFVRIPMDYRFLVKDFNYLQPDMGMLKYLDLYLSACKERKLHMCLNMHRVPGYCVGSRNSEERDNLWTDLVAQEGFIFLWEAISRHFLGVDSEYLSFNLINEPPVVGRYGCSREVHQDLIRRTIKAIKAIDPKRQIIIDGLEQGGSPLPELYDVDAIQSCRGYQPGLLTHYGAPWSRFANEKSPLIYPGTLSDGIEWNKEALYDFYKPWVDIQSKGVHVHVGEFGCFSLTPDHIALCWYSDVLEIYKQFGWGFAMWEFEGAFGIINHGRPGAIYENYHGYKVDRRLLELVLGAMIK